MSNFSIQVYKNISSNKPPEISLPVNLPQSDLVNPVLIKTAKELFAKNGVLVIKNLFAKDFIAELNQSFSEQYNTYFEDKDHPDALGVGVKRKMITVNFQYPFNHPNLYGNPLLMYLMQGLLGKDFILGSFGAVIALPGAEQQHIHQDHPALFEDEALDLKLPSFAITVVVPLIDLTPATGSTQVWKGSHRLSQSEELEKRNSSVPFVSTGSCYLMDYQLWHGGTPNISNQVRPILYIVYYRSWFQETVNYEKQTRVSITQREYQKIPEIYKFLFVRVQELFQFSQPTHLDKNYHPPSNDQSQDYTPVNPLTASEQVNRLSKVAKQSLTQYGVEPTALKLISHGENTVFAVDTPNLSITKQKSVGKAHRRYRYSSSRFALRVHRANYLPIDAIDSELRWLQFLSQEAQLPVPEPIPTLNDKLCTLSEAQGVPEPRVCSLTRWLNGSSLSSEDTSQESQLLQLESVGRLLGQLHDHAEHWSIPENFTRPRWDWNGLFGDMAGYSNDGAKVWDLTPQPYRNLFESVSQQFKETIALLTEDRSQFGLIHGDFWSGNILIDQQEMRIIDFADCGFGYWVYDLARFLNDYIYERDFSLYLDKLLHGYNQIRPFPQAQLPHLKTFIIAQYAAYGLWQINRAQDHPSFRARLEQELQETAEVIEWLMVVN
ncbi:MAG: phosphotransferase [Coleofasciculus sp. A1-SPW-01]|uniref:phosphotransferase n=1 Tax=Coleofasciculus sp. A1-SPW-01 TaxID=3070819 RepID=UPI0032FEFB6F